MNKSAYASAKNGHSQFAAGIFFGIIAALAFGTNPLFARMLYQQGFSVDSVLLFRFLPAAAALGAVMVVRRSSFRLSRKELLFCVSSGLLFCLTSLALFKSYQMMDVGVAATLLFVYPVLVTIISAIFFREKIKLQTLAALVVAVAGVAFLSATPSKTPTGLLGIVIALLAALFYAGYLVVVGLNKKFQIKSGKLTFYVLVTCVVFYASQTLFGVFRVGSFNTVSCLSIAGLSIISAIVSLSCAALALKRCSATDVAVLGALEPLSATFWGVAVFHEILNWQIVLGMGLILVSVFLVICPVQCKKGCIDHHSPNSE